MPDDTPRLEADRVTADLDALTNGDPAMAQHYVSHTTGHTPNDAAPSFSVYAFTDGGPMPDPTVPADNPYRDNAVRADFAGGPDDSTGLGLSVDDVNVLLARHYEHGRHVGAREALEGNRALLARTYDTAWQNGMSDHHARTSLTYGQRIHALHELLAIVPQLPAPLALPLLLDVAALAGQVIDSCLADHARGAFGLPEGNDEVPEPGATDADLSESPTPQMSEDALRARVVQLRDWLRERVGVAVEA